MDVAGAVLLAQIPGIIPERELRGFGHSCPRSFSLMFRR
jgi:hypothetical protein